MRVFIAGNGSMGRRRERDLRALGHQATAYDAWPSRGLTPEQERAFDAAELVVVSTPPLEHTRVAVWAADRGIPCFTEADVVAVGSPHFPSATSRFTDFYELFYGALPLLGRTVAYSLHVGQHLEDWHPGADLNTYYAAQRETGACREMVPFELCWLTGLFGAVARAGGEQFVGERIDDVYQVVLLHTSGVVGHLLIDALSRPPVRRFTIVADGDSRTYTLAYREEHYAREIYAFVDAAQGRAQWPYSQSDERANLDVLRVIERV